MNFKGKNRFFNYNKGLIEIYMKFLDSVIMLEGLGNVIYLFSYLNCL